MFQNNAAICINKTDFTIYEYIYIFHNAVVYTFLPVHILFCVYRLWYS